MVSKVENSSKDKNKDEKKLIKWKINEAVILDDISNEADKLYGSNTQIDYIVETLENLVFISMAIDDNVKVIEHPENLDLIKSFRVKTLNYMKSFRCDIAKLYDLRYNQLKSKSIKEIVDKSNVKEELKSIKEIVDKSNVKEELKSIKEEQESIENISDEKILEIYIKNSEELKLIGEIFVHANDMVDVYSENTMKLNNKFLLGKDEAGFDKLYDSIKLDVIGKIADVSERINEKVMEKIDTIKREAE